MSTQDLGCIRDSCDGRDLLYAKGIAGLPAPQAKTKVSLIADLSPVENQGETRSCVGQAVVGALEYLQRKEGPAIPNVNLSALFVYYNARTYLRPGIQPSDFGSHIRDALRALKKLGVCSSLLWPWDVKHISDKPPDPCYAAALDYPATFYWRIGSLNEMRDCLARGYPFIFNFLPDDSFFSSDVAKQGVVTMPKGPLQKDHAVVAVGYDDEKQVFTARNSKGSTWGQDGYFTIPYAYVSSTTLCHDRWTMRHTESLGPQVWDKSEEA